MNFKNLINSIFLITFLSFIVSCGDDGKTTPETEMTNVESKRTGVNEVIIHINSDPDRLNTITGTDANSSNVGSYIFEYLLKRNKKTLQYEPHLAKGPALMEDVLYDVYGEEKEVLKYTYTIRDEAKWADGSPITGYDFEFYLKCIKNPKVDCESLRPYVEAIIDVEVNSENPKIVAFVFQNKYFAAEELANEMTPLQISEYDAEGLMKEFSVKDLTDPKKVAKLSENKNINVFANKFNSEEYSREIILGSGPYTYKSWVTGERIILEKNPNWWAKDLVGKEPQFTNGPDKLVFEIIADMTTAVTAQKDESIDLMVHTSKHYNELIDNESFLSKFKFETPIRPSYSYIGLNTKKPYLSDKKVRKALSMAVDYQTLIDVYLYGLAERTASPIHPNKNYYNNKIELYPFDLEKASALLDEAGWKDEDGDGVREKEIEGEEVLLKLEFLYPGSDFAKNMALILKKNFAQIGIELEVVSKEWTVFLEDVKSHNFDMITMAWMMGPGLSDMKQIWHQESYNGGSNYTGFGNEYTDELIDKIRYELDEEKRNEMYMEIQEIIHDEASYIFLFTSKSLMAMHKRFDNAEGYLVRPGYDVSKFQLNNFGMANKPTAE